MAPQLTYLFLVFVSFGITLAKHRQPNQYNAITAFIALVIDLSLLYAGGFFNPLFK